MKLDIQTYGKILSSRPAGREAALTALAYAKDLKSAQKLRLNFEGVRVMTPSWLSEFVQTLKGSGILEFEFLNTSNPSVSESIEIIKGDT